MGSLNTFNLATQVLSDEKQNLKQSLSLEIMADRSHATHQLGMLCRQAISKLEESLKLVIFCESDHF